MSGRGTSIPSRMALIHGVVRLPPRLRFGLVRDRGADPDRAFLPWRVRPA